MEKILKILDNKSLLLFHPPVSRRQAGARQRGPRSQGFWLKETYFPVTEAPKEKVCTKLVAVICESTISRRDKCTEWDLAKYQVIKPSAFGSSSHNYRIKNLTDPTEQYTLSHWNVTSVTEVCKEYGYADR